MIQDVSIRLLTFTFSEQGRSAQLFGDPTDAIPAPGSLLINAIHPQSINAWRYHKDCKISIICFKGMIKLALFDGRQNSKTFGELSEFFIGEFNSQIIEIPPGVYYGWKGISQNESWLVTAASKKQVTENRLPFDSDFIPYTW